MTNKIEQAVNSAVSKASPANLVMTILLIGAITGGGGHMLYDLLLSSDDFIDVIVAVDQLTQTLSEIHRVIEQQDIRVRRVACEIEALRMDSDWLSHCYAPNAPGMR